MSSIFVGGRFDDLGGRKSKISKTIYDSMGFSKNGWADFGYSQSYSDFYNGGYYNNLEGLMPDLNHYEVIYWMAELQEDKPKLSRFIKKANPHCVYVGSTRNLDGQKSFREMVADSLMKKSNLNVEFLKKGSLYYGRIFDPLGNVFLDYNSDFGIVGKVLERRSSKLQDLHRTQSNQLGVKEEVPNNEKFFEIVKSGGEIFHELIPGLDGARFLGNASFRCRFGFPSFRKDGMIYVSRRNVDKRQMERDGFVRVELVDGVVGYYGNDKPSVDTPVQLKLYDFYKNIDYMLHGHVYVREAPFTSKILPCGILEEFDEIKSVFLDRSSRNFAINLLGHGSIVFASDLDYLASVKYFPRNFPEYFDLGVGGKNE